MNVEKKKTGNKPDRKQFLNRELSWLEFNARVLDEAGDAANPLLERLKFIAIFSNNLDEFFMVRVAGLRQQLESGTKSNDPAGLSTETQLNKIRSRVITLINRQYRYLERQILPRLEKGGIQIIKPEQLSIRQRYEIRQYFEHNILPVLTPIAVDPSHPFPRLNNCAIEIAVRLRRENHPKPVHAFVEVPSGLPRFIPVADSGKQSFVMLEKIIINQLHALFSGCEIIDAFPFRITRDMDFSIDEEGVRDLLIHIEKKLLHRRRREPIRLELPRNTRGPLFNWLRKSLGITPAETYSVPGELNPASFFELITKVNGEELLEPKWPPLPLPEIPDDSSVFTAMDKYGSIMNCVPFQSFSPVVRIIEEAAEDPDVLAIKQTLYRVSGKSPVVNALQRAAKNGKQVTVIVELKARFDEESNISWARSLEESGAHVVYGIAGLKIHCKALLIIRREEGLIRRYLHLSTGNYNDKTARIYTDTGMFLTDPELCSEIANLFNVMTGYSAHSGQWQRIAVAPFDLRERFISLIDRESRLSSAHQPGQIIAKMNSLVDPQIIEHLFRAARAGVKIDLIVRGICCLRPNPQLPNLRVISIVDRFLEHSRIFFFANGDDPEYYLASADWMPRNLDRRIEVMFPVDDPEIRETVSRILELQLGDKRKSRRLLPSGRYTRTISNRLARTRSQWLTYQLFQKQIPQIEQPVIQVFD